MRKMIAMMGVAAFALSLGLVARAAEDTKISGMAQCAKCALKEAKECQNVIVVKDGDKETKYYLVQNDVAKKAHQALGFCTAPKGEGPTVKAEGTCEKKDDKLVFTATKIEAVEE